jgi:PadR family transcriptional regulator PadR
MIKSSEFIKGYTEIIVCALLMDGDDYIYNLVKKINNHNSGCIQISNPSMLMIMKKLTLEGKVSSYIKTSTMGADRRYYKLTDIGIKFYKENVIGFIESIETLKELVLGDMNYGSKD